VSNPRRRRANASSPPRLAVGIGLLALTIVFVLPLLGLLWRAPWSAIGDVVRDPDARQALRLSLVCSFAATLASIALGLPLAWLVARGDFRGRSLLRALATLPLVLPPVVGGLALFYAFGRRGLIGQWLDSWFDVQLPFTVWAAILAETFVALPFFVLTVEGALRGLDGRAEHAAATLGAGPWRIFLRVTLPSIRGSLLAGAALSWARALGEFGATITFAGNLAGRTQTLPLAIYNAFQTNDPAGVMLSILLLAVSIVVLVAVGGRVLSARRQEPGAST
jgi:molybdate transport system permease protein